MRGRLLAALVVWGVLAHAAAALAGVRPPSLRGEATLRGESVSLWIEATNVGGAALHQVFPRLRIGDRLEELEAEPELAIGATARWTHGFSRGLLRGEDATARAVLVRIHYQDGTSYPFSVPLVLGLGKGSPGTAGPLRGTLEVAGSSELPRVVLRLVNGSQQQLEGLVTFFSSIELLPRPARTPFRAPAGKEVELFADLQVDGAVVGSHTVYAVAQPAGGGPALILSGPLEVSQAMVERPAIRPRAAGLAAVLVVLFLVTSFLELRAVRSSRATSGD